MYLQLTYPLFWLRKAELEGITAKYCMHGGILYCSCKQMNVALLLLLKYFQRKIEQAHTVSATVSLACIINVAQTNYSGLA